MDETEGSWSWVTWPLDKAVGFADTVSSWFPSIIEPEPVGIPLSPTSGAGRGLGGLYNDLVGGIFRPFLVPVIVLIVLVVAVTILIGRVERAAGGS